MHAIRDDLGRLSHRPLLASTRPLHERRVLRVEGADAVCRARAEGRRSGPRRKGPTWAWPAAWDRPAASIVPGRIYRSDRMAATGLYDDGKKGIRRLTEPELRIKDQDRDGVQAEVLYGILGVTGRLNDAEAAVEITRIYNEWLAGFCATHPERFAGLAGHPEPSARRRHRRGRARRQAWRAARPRHRELRRPQAALGSVLESAVGGHQRHGPAPSLPHGRRSHPGSYPEADARRLRSDARDAGHDAGGSAAWRARPSPPTSRASR